MALAVVHFRELDPRDAFLDGATVGTLVVKGGWRAMHVKYGGILVSFRRVRFPIFLRC